MFYNVLLYFIEGAAPAGCSVARVNIFCYAYGRLTLHYATDAPKTRDAKLLAYGLHCFAYFHTTAIGYEGEHNSPTETLTSRWNKVTLRELLAVRDQISPGVFDRSLHLHFNSKRSEEA